MADSPKEGKSSSQAPVAGAADGEPVLKKPPVLEKRRDSEMSRDKQRSFSRVLSHHPQSPV